MIDHQETQFISRKQPPGSERAARPHHAGDAEQQPLTVSIIVPVHRGGEAFQTCLESIRSASPPPDEVIVVADGETDGSENHALGLGMKVVRTPTRSGPAAARNLGARLASGDILLFIDADVVVSPATIRTVLQAFHDHPDVSAIIGSYDDAPAAGNFLSQYKNLFHHYVHQHAHEQAFTFWGACGAIRRQVFVEAGGFDEHYPQPSTEDIEFGYRLRALGHRLLLCKALEVKHLKQWSAGSLLRTDFFHRAVPWTQLILRTRRIDNDLNIDWASRIKVLLVYLLVLALGLGCWQREGWLAALGLAVILLVLDAPLLRFFQRKRGLGFALRVIPWQWFYYLYCGLGFAVGAMLYFIQDGRERVPRPATLNPAPLPSDGVLVRCP
ncbi:MAG TPA: glycosyltransferase [Gemmataceae bacterium]|nr:glycosyltransferase [Gemmataceae bacterium]